MCTNDQKVFDQYLQITSYYRNGKKTYNLRIEQFQNLTSSYNSIILLKKNLL